MRHLYYYYPSFLRFLIPLFVLQQTAFQLFFYNLQLIQYTADGSSGDLFWIGGELFEHILGFTGIAMIFAGILASKIGNTKTTFLWITSFMLLGHVVFCLQIPYLSFLGALICMFATCLFFIKVILNIAVLFPVANDQKDNSLLAGIFLPYIILFSMALILSLVIARDFSMIGILSCSLIIYLTLIYLINQNNDLGYEIEEGEPTEEDLKHHQKGKFVLLGCSLILFIASVCSSFLGYLGDLGNTYYSGGLGDLFSTYFYYPMGGILPILAVFIYLIIAFFKAKTFSNQFKTIMIGLISIVVCAVLDLMNTFYGNNDLELFVNNLPDYILIIMITIPMLSVITHLNFGKNAPIWLGLFYGGTQLGIYLSAQLAGVIIPIKFMAWGSLILLIGSIIYLRDNKDFLLKQLALDEPNQIVDDEEEENLEEDPLNHLIDRSRSE